MAIDCFGSTDLFPGGAGLELPLKHLVQPHLVQRSQRSTKVTCPITRTHKLSFGCAPAPPAAANSGNLEPAVLPKRFPGLSPEMRGQEARQEAKRFMSQPDGQAQTAHEITSRKSRLDLMAKGTCV